MMVLKPKGGAELVFKQNELLKPKLQKLLLHGLYHKTFINQTQSILNQFTLYTRSLLKFLLSKRYFLEPLVWLRLEWERKIRSREDVHNLFILVHSLSLEKLIQLSNPKPKLDFHYAYKILTINHKQSTVLTLKFGAGTRYNGCG